MYGNVPLTNANGTPRLDANGNPVYHHITMNEYYQYRLAIRPGFNALPLAGKLFQRYIVDAWVKTEGNTLNFYRENQTQLRCENYSGLLDYVNRRAEYENLAPGRVTVLPTSFNV